jgi:elongation factor G
MKVYQTNEIRNIALVGGAKSGKTTLAEAILFEGGVIKRRGSIEDKNTVSDYREIEIERQNSVFSTVLYAEYAGKKINIIDAPGFDDFMGEVIAALKVAETSVLVVNAQNGVEVGTEITWRYTTRYEKPVIFVVNQLEHEKANFEETMNALHTQFGNKVIPAQFPVTTGGGFNAIVDVISMKLFKYGSEGGKAQILEIPADLMGKAEELRNQIIEAAAESDEALMEKYFENGTLSDDEISKGLVESIKQRNIYPLFCVSAKLNMGVDRLLEFVASSLPAPDEVAPVKTKEGKEVKCLATEPLTAFIFKTAIESHLGEVSFFKVCSGTITESMDVINSTNSSKERASQLFITAGKSREKVEKIVAGDIGSTIKLKNVGTNQTLTTSKNSSDEIEPIVYPDPKYRTAIKAASSSDDEKLGGILNEMHKIDPTFIYFYSKELKQMIVEGQGELHINIAKWQIETLEKFQLNS